MKSNRKSQYNELHDLIFEFQRVQRFKGAELGIGHDQLGEGLSYTEESVLFVLDAGEATNVKDLSERVGLERSWMSRMVGGLLDRGLLQSRPDPEDGRSKILELTREGEKQLLKAEANAKEIFTQSFATLSATKQKELEKLLSAFADGLGARKFKKHRSGHALGFQLGRISSIIGIYGRTLFGTEITNTQLHILLILDKYRNFPLQISDIDQCVSFDMSTVSRTVQSLVDDGLIEKNQGASDKRSVALSLSREGESVFKAYRKQAVAILAKGLDELSDAQLDKLLSYYRDITAGLPHPGVRTDHVRRSRLTLKPLVKSEPSARSESTMLKRLGNLQRSVGAYKGSKLVAAVGADFSKQDGSLSELTLVNNGADLKDCKALVDALLKS